MPRFKDYNQGQTVLLSVSFDWQILPGTFEYTLNYLEKETDITCQFVTNALDIPVQTVADLYKERWRIELFFSGSNRT